MQVKRKPHFCKPDVHSARMIIPKEDPFYGKFG